MGTLKDKGEKQMVKGLPDIQKTKDTRGISISRVGVENIKFPLYIATKDGGKREVTANVHLYGSLRHQVKGVNMSRFVETLMEFQYTDLTRETMGEMLEALRTHMGVEDVEDVYAEINFDYFLTKYAPVSKKKMVMDYRCGFVGKLRKDYTFQLKVKVLTTSNCPCSREISDYGAHGQRSFTTATITPVTGSQVWLEDIISAIERCGSSEVFPLLKREDEKWVTEQAFNNAKFVEDYVRDVGVALQSIDGVKKFKIKQVNEESIHPHEAVAYLARKLQKGVWVIDHAALRS